MASVELKGLSKHYGSAVAVDDVSLCVCGKTTTLRLIAGFIEPPAGEIVVGGKSLSSPTRTVPPEGRNMSMILQSYALWPHMTVAENVAYGLKIRKLDRATIDAKPAGARVACPHARGRTRDPAARRATLQPRCQLAQGDALRNPPAARSISLHKGGSSSSVHRRRSTEKTRSEFVARFKYDAPRPIRLSELRLPVAALALLVLAMPLFLPYAALFNSAFSPVALRIVGPETVTLHNVRFTFLELSSTMPALKNTFLLATASAATLGALLALPIAYIVARQAVVGHRVLAFLATAPLAIPGIVLGIGLFLGYTRPPLALYGTL